MLTGDARVRCGRGGGVVTLLLQCFYYVFRLILRVIFDLFHAARAGQLGYADITS
jgi:hypothetical protein